MARNVTFPLATESGTSVTAQCNNPGHERSLDNMAVCDTL